MVEKLFSSNKASIARKSSHNIILQGNDVDIYNPVFCSSSTDMIKTLGELGRYDIIQKQVKEMLSAVSSTHPLYPDFSARPNQALNKLVSTPETEDAFARYPRRIKGTFLLDYEKYPYMDKGETPWEYAYRTQTSVELETTAYQEYLGEVEDPFPVVEFADGMVTVIGAPSFPPAVEATISSGDISIPISLRRKPCMEYGEMIFGTVSNACGFSLDITAHKGQKRTDFTITKVPECNLATQLQREKLIDQIRRTKHLEISVGDSRLVSAELKEEDLSADMFKAAPYMVRYIESLLAIEKHMSCKFDLAMGEVLGDDYRAALILASSLEGKWHTVKENFDDQVRCDYDQIPEDLADEDDPQSIIGVEGEVLGVSVQGQRFAAEKYIIIYKDARVNNLASVMKNRKKKKKNILITFRPVVGKEFFYKSSMFEGIRLIKE